MTASKALSSSVIPSKAERSLAVSERSAIHNSKRFFDRVGKFRTGCESDGPRQLLLENGRTGESLENLREAEAIYRKLYSDANLQLGDNLRLQAHAFFSEGKYSEAEARINETLKIYRAATSQQFINYATALMVQGLIYSQTGRTAEAETQRRIILERSCRFFSESS